MKKLAKQRDYKREYENAVTRGDTVRYKTVGTKIPFDLYEMFRDKAEKNNTTAGALIRNWIESYLFD